HAVAPFHRHHRPQRVPGALRCLRTVREALRGVRHHRRRRRRSRPRVHHRQQVKDPPMTHIDELAALGTSTWLDDLSRDRITSGNLAELIESKSIVGVTTNPAIFAAAMTKGDSYDAQIAELKESGAAVDEAVYAMSVDDVR